MLNRSCRGVNPFAQLYKLRMKNFTIKAKTETETGQRRGERGSMRERKCKGSPTAEVIAAANVGGGRIGKHKQGKLVSLVLSLALPLSLSGQQSSLVSESSVLSLL